MGKIGVTVAFLCILCPAVSSEELQNVALGKPVIMSSTLQGWSLNNTSSAVDGKLSIETNKCGCCVSSDNESNAWLTVDLQEEYLVQKVIVTGRSDELRNETTRNLHNLQMFNGDRFSTVQVTSHIEIINNQVAIAKNLGNMSIRMVTLKRPRLYSTSEWFLTVCEIEIYIRVCHNRTYGINGVCNQCGHCVEGRDCDRVTGQCPGGCGHGYTGDTCTQECSPFTYGQNCSKVCGQCVSNETCNPIDGVCIRGCSEDFLGDLCQITRALGGETPTSQADIPSGIIGALIGFITAMCLAVVVAVVWRKRLRNKGSTYEEPKWRAQESKGSTYEEPQWRAQEIESEYCDIDNGQSSSK